MKAQLRSVQWKLDTDCVEGSNGLSYDIGYVEQSSNGQLSIMLDTNPIEHRITVFQNFGNWMVESYHGTVCILEDQALLEFLQEVERTIPPVDRRES